MARNYDDVSGLSFDNDFGYFDGPDPLFLSNLVEIASAEAFGTPEARLTLEDPTAIPSLEAFGTCELYHKLFASPVVSGEAFGTLLAEVTWTELVGEESSWNAAGSEESSWTSANSVDSTWEV